MNMFQQLPSADIMLNMMNMVHKDGFNKNTGFQRNNYVIQKEKFLKLNLNDKEKIDELMNKALKRFKNTVKTIGSINIDSLYWTKFFINKCYANLQEDKKYQIIVFGIDNGCCSIPSCPFNIYFKILEELINYD